MLRPMMNAPAATMASIWAALASGCSNIHWVRRSTGPSQKGLSALWFGPAVKPSTDTALSQVTFVISHVAVSLFRHRPRRRSRVGRSRRHVLDMTDEFRGWRRSQRCHPNHPGGTREQDRDAHQQDRD